ncbi:hypothetical protein MRX96_030147 [Rhipicephalus microplus]
MTVGLVARTSGRATPSTGCVPPDVPLTLARLGLLGRAGEKLDLSFLLALALVHLLLLAPRQLLVVRVRAPAVRVVRLRRVVCAQLVNAAVGDQLLVDARVAEVLAHLDRRIHVAPVAHLALVEARDLFLQSRRAVSRWLGRQEHAVRTQALKAAVEGDRRLGTHVQDLAGLLLARRLVLVLVRDERHSTLRIRRALNAFVLGGGLRLRVELAFRIGVRLGQRRQRLRNRRVAVHCGHSRTHHTQ